MQAQNIHAQNFRTALTLCIHGRERQYEVRRPLSRELLLFRLFTRFTPYRVRACVPCRCTLSCCVVVKSYPRENSMPSKKKKYNARFPAVSEYILACGNT